MADTSLQAIFAEEHDVGRPVILVARLPSPADDYGKWDESAPIVFQNPGNTEGEIAVADTSAYQSLTLEENGILAPLKKYHVGEAPVLEFNAFINPITERLYSPTGSGSGGNSRQRRVKEHTVWVAPEELFLEYDTSGEAVEVAVDPIAQTKNGVAFDAEATRLFGVSRFYWRGHFTRASAPFRWENAGKNIAPVSFHTMFDKDKPEGHMIWTQGSDLAASGIDLNGAS